MSNTTTHPLRLARRIVLIVTLLLASVIGVSASTTGAAHAAAYGCSAWGTKNVGGWSVPSGQYCAYIPGSGTWISGVSGGFTSAGNVCNWDVTAEFFDSNWKWKRTYVSSRYAGCTHGSAKAISIPYYMSQLTGSNYGYMCSTLRVAGQRVTSVCHYIHP